MMEPCDARLADPHWGGAGVRVDVQSAVSVKPEQGMGKGIEHNVAICHYWRLSCPHCLMDGGLHLIDNPVKFGKLEMLQRRFAERHDELQGRVVAKEG